MPCKWQQEMEDLSTKIEAMEGDGCQTENAVVHLRPVICSGATSLSSLGMIF